MYAVIEQGSKQYKVAEGDKIEIELTDLAPDAKTIELNKVLFIGGDGNNRVGKPYIEGAKVIGSFPSPETAVVKGKKLYVTSFHRRKSNQRRHRPPPEAPADHDRQDRRMILGAPAACGMTCAEPGVMLGLAYAW